MKLTYTLVFLGLIQYLASTGAVLSKSNSRVSKPAATARPPANSKLFSSRTSIDDGQPEESLLKVNTMMFVFYTTVGATLPYLPMYYKHIKLTANQIGFLGAVTPAVTFLVSPLWGALADSTGKYKSIMLGTFIASVVTRLMTIQSGVRESMFLLTGIVALAAACSAPVKPIMDSAVMGMLKDKADYGRSRLFGQLGFGIGSWITGYFLSKVSESLFYVQAALAIPATFLMLKFNPKNIEKKESNVSVTKGLTYAFKDINLLVFFGMVFVIGASAGLIETFGYVRLEELNAKKDNCIGLLRLASSLVGGPMFHFAGPITRRVGIHGILSITLLAFVARFAIYSVLTNPWQALPAEMLRGITFAMLWSGCTYHVYQASPKGLTATMLGLLNGIYGGLGPTMGSLVGGVMTKKMGLQSTFRWSAIIDTIALAAYSAYLLVQRFSITDASREASTLSNGKPASSGTRLNAVSKRVGVDGCKVGFAKNQSNSFFNPKILSVLIVALLTKFLI